MMRLLLLLAVALASTASAQYTETFPIDDRGVAGPCTADPTTCSVQDFSGVTWTLSGDASGLDAGSDFFQTSGGSLVAQDLDTVVCWDSPEISTSGTVTLAFDLSEAGDHEDEDYLDVQYQVDGGGFVAVANVQGQTGQPTLIGDYDAAGNPTDDDFEATTVTVPGVVVASTLHLRVCALNNAGAETLRIDEVRVTSGGAGQVVTLSASPLDGGTIRELGAESTAMTLTVDTSDDATTEAEITADVVLAQGSNDGDFTTTVSGIGAVAFDENTPYGLTIPVGTPDGATLMISMTAIDDGLAEGDESFQAQVQNVVGATVAGSGTFDFVIEDDDFEVATAVVINEIRIDSPVSGDEEYLELKGVPGTVLTGLWIVVIGDGAAADGSGVIEGDGVIDLAGQTIPADGYFVIAEGPLNGLGSDPQVDLTTPLGFENSDNVTFLLVQTFSGSEGDDLDTDDDGTLDATAWDAILDAVSLVEDPDGGEAYYAERVALLGGWTGDAVGPDGSSVPAHVYRNESSGTYQLGAFDRAEPSAEGSPGTANPSAIEQASITDQAGYRLLSLPIVSATGADLAEVSLVQGATGQYPDADPNVYPGFDGTDFTPLGSTGDALASGQGVFQYFFDLDLNPPNTGAGGGTSQSRELSTFVYSLAGTTPSADVSYPVAAANGDAVTDGAYMIGNPFAEPLDLFGITMSAGDGVLSRTFQAWDPTASGGAGGYVALDGTVDDGTFLDVYQGVFATVAYGGDPTTPPTFAFDIDETDALATPVFVGRRAAPLAVGLDLVGEGAGGVRLGDGLADVWFREEGAIGGDPVDAPELSSPGKAVAALALRDGDGLRAVRGLPLALDGAVETPVAFRTTVPGLFTVAFDPDLRLPDGIEATLTDLVTRTVYLPGASISFEADSTGWTDRFLLTVSGTAVASGAGADVALAIGEVFPNPSTGRARLSVSVEANQRVRVEVVDALGRVVAVPFVGDLAAGAAHEVALPEGLSAGLYAVRVSGETFVASRRMVVVR